MSETTGQSSPPLVGEVRNVDQAHLFLIVLTLLLVAGLLVFIVVLPSWRPKHDMNIQPHFNPGEASEFFPDRMSNRPFVSGVVPRPTSQSPGIPYVAVRSPGPANYPVVAQTDTIPFPITRQVLERGQLLYNINCAMCHGAQGNGDGMIVRRGFFPPPSYHIERLRTVPDSHFFNVITNGYGTMFSHSDRVAPDDRWNITAYIRALQLAIQENPALSDTMQKPKGVQP